MTRIEVFSDAAFAFAVTMLVVSLDAIPRNYGEFLNALNGIPAFVLSFSIIMGYWLVHRKWSQHYGLEEPVSTVLTLVIVVDILFFVYPLKMMMSCFAHFVSGGRLPTEFSIASASEATGLVIAFGVGSLVLSFAFAGLYLRALQLREELKLSSFEFQRTQEQLVIWAVICGSIILSLLVALILDPEIGYIGGYGLCLPLVLIPAVKIYFKKLGPEQRT